MRNNIKFVLIGVLFFAIGSLCFYFLPLKKENTVWLNANKVFDEFTLKKELEGKFKTVESQRKKITDSLELELNIIVKSLQYKKKPTDEEMNFYQQKKEVYLLKKEQFDEDNTNMRNSYNEQILKQMNQYVNEYGKAHNYDYILGQDGTSGLMYAKDKKEVTEEVINYINKKYKGE